MKKKFLSLTVLAGAIILLSVLAFHVRIGATADSVVVLSTTGMTCGSCASRISQSLEATKGVASTEVDVEGGWVVVGYDKKVVKPEALAATVSSTGFGSTVHQVMTPDQFRQITGRDIGAPAGGKPCCGGKGCGTDRKS